MSVLLFVEAWMSVLFCGGSINDSSVVFLGRSVDVRASLVPGQKRGCPCFSLKAWMFVLLYPCFC